MPDPTLIRLPEPVNVPPYEAAALLFPIDKLMAVLPRSCRLTVPTPAADARLPSVKLVIPLLNARAPAPACACSVSLTTPAP